MTGINEIAKINGIPVYQDQYMDDDKFIVMYKSKSVMEPGLVFVPTEKWNEGLAKCKGAAIDHEEVDRILKMKKDRKLEDVTAIICKESSDEIIEKITRTLETQFK